MSDFSVRRADWERDTEALREVRTRVFIEEQHVPLDLEWDGLDPECIHMLAEASGRPIGTGRLTPDGRVGRMAVLSEWRGRGVGERLLLGLMAASRARGDTQCVLDAQVSAIGFYERFGFEAEGGIFLDAGIDHQRMRLDYARGGDGRRLEGYGALADGLLRVARTARHEFALYAPDLAPRLTDSAEFAAALKEIALSGSRGTVRLLGKEARTLAQSGNAVLRVVGALPTHCAVHLLCDEDEPTEEVYAFNDAGGVFHQPRAESATAKLVLNSPLAAREMQHRFDPLWERSVPAPDARRLNI